MRSACGGLVDTGGGVGIDDALSVGCSTLGRHLRVWILDIRAILLAWHTAAMTVGCSDSAQAEQTRKLSAVRHHQGDLEPCHHQPSFCALLV